MSEWECPDYLEEMMTEDPETGKELIGIFLEDTASRLEDFTHAVNVGDRHAIRRIAHGMKGSSAQMGAMNMSAVCADMERKAAESDMSTLEAEIAALRARFLTVRELMGGA